MYIEDRDWIIAEIYDERSDVRFSIKMLSFDELQDLCSFHKTFRICAIDYDPINDVDLRYEYNQRLHNEDDFYDPLKEYKDWYANKRYNN